MPYDILIVDDSLLTRVAIKRILDMIETDISHIYEAGNGIEALEVLDSNHIDLVLADLNMPQMGGVELVNKMKEGKKHADVPVVIVSTESSTTRIEELLEKGIKDYLHKPFTPEEFRSILAKNLEVCNDNN